MNKIKVLLLLSVCVLSSSVVWAMKPTKHVEADEHYYWIEAGCCSCLLQDGRVEKKTKQESVAARRRGYDVTNWVNGEALILSVELPASLKISLHERSESDDTIVGACKSLVSACKLNRRSMQEKAVQMVLDALAAGHNPNEKDEDGNSGVKVLGEYFGTHEAPFCEFFPRVVRMLLEAKAEVTEERYLGNRTLLHQAAGRGYADLIEPLVQAGIDVDEGSKDSAETPLKRAASMAEFCQRTNKGNNNAAIQILLDLRANPNAQDYDGSTPLYWADTTEAAQLLIANEADIEVRKRDGGTPLIHAARSNYLALVQVLLENGASIDAKDNNGHTALDKAEEYQRFVSNGEKIRAIIKLLRDHVRQK